MTTVDIPYIYWAFEGIQKTLKQFTVDIPNIYYH
jgi:hypothetical protein